MRTGASRGGRTAAVAVGAALLAAPLFLTGGVGQYILHVMIQIFIWAFIGQAWSLMGRFGLVSLGHGAFLGLGAYTVALLWNFFHLTPWIGAAVAVAATAAFAAVVAYPCSRFRVVGHYFGLVTLAVGEVVRLLIIAERDWTGGSLGLRSRRPARTASWRSSSPTAGSSTTAPSSSGWPGSGCGAGSIARWRGRRWRRSGRTRPRRRRSAST